MGRTAKTVQKKRGRPTAGKDPHVTARFPRALVDALKQWATMVGVSRSEAIRQLVESGLSAKGKPPRK